MTRDDTAPSGMPGDDATGRAASDAQKRAAAEAAVALIEDGMVVGLGTGSTATFAVRSLAVRVAQGLRVVGIPTSERTAELARGHGIALTDLATEPVIDLTIDGADEVERTTLQLIKGLGGALLREKIVAAASRRMIVIVDESKIVDRLGTRAPVPVEIVAFGAEATLRHLTELGTAPTLRLIEGRPFRTDNGNLIADCATGPIDDPTALAARLVAIPGVVDSGLFLDLASHVVVGSAAGTQHLERSALAS